MSSGFAAGSRRLQLKKFCDEIVSGVAGNLADPRKLLWIGIIIRVVTGMALAPDNVDVHSDVLRFIVAHKALPHALDLHEGHSPPFYYLLAVPLFAVSGYVKVVQILSLALSIGTLLILYDLIYRKGLIEHPRARSLSFLLACLLPEFVMFSLFVSNDTLTFFLGAWSILLVYQFVQSPTWKHLALLAGVLGLGLLTKHVVLAVVPVLAALVFLRSRSFGTAGALRRAVLFLMIALSLGSYKFVENYRYYGRALVSNMDANPDWAADHRRSYRGWRSFVDVNVAKLVISPSVSDVTSGSYPVLLYATFWWQHSPDSSFAWHTPLNRLGQLIYLISPFPTAAFLIGIVELARRAPGFGANLWRTPEFDAKLVTNYTAAACLLAYFGLVIATVLKYHQWDIMHGRLLFPAFFGCLVVFSAGVERVERWRIPRAVLIASMYVLAGLFAIFLLLEFVLAVRYRLMMLGH